MPEEHDGAHVYVKGMVRTMGILQSALRLVGQKELATPASLEARFARASRTPLDPYAEETRGHRLQQETGPSSRLSRESVYLLHVDVAKRRGAKLRGYFVVLPDAGDPQAIPLENQQQQDDIAAGGTLRFNFPTGTNLVVGSGKLYLELDGKPAWVFEGIRIPASVPERLSL
jgi:hypothetical protein